MQERKVGLDSQCLSYLIDAIDGVEEPTDPLAEEKKALLRTWFYLPSTFYVSETVVSECADIRHIDRRELHEIFIRTGFLDLPIRDRAKVGERVAQLMKAHPEEPDCRILAEAEDLGLDTLLTYDRNFMKRLNSLSVVTLACPSAFWDSLSIPRGVRPVTVPSTTNPLSKQSWWRW